MSHNRDERDPFDTLFGPPAIAPNPDVPQAATGEQFAESHIEREWARRNGADPDEFVEVLPADVLFTGSAFQINKEALEDIL